MPSSCITAFVHTAIRTLLPIPIPHSDSPFPIPHSDSRFPIPDSSSQGMSTMNWIMEGNPREYIVEGVLGGVDLWANKVRKEYRKTKPEHCTFCDTFKALIQGLAEYCKTHHTKGVAYNPKGTKKMSDFNPSDAPPPAPAAAAPAPAASASKPAGGPMGGGMGSMMAELAKKRTAAGDSAATGLKTVSKDQQTWRKEFAGGDAPAPKVAPKVKAPVKKASKVATKPPLFEFDSSGHNWKVEVS